MKYFFILLTMIVSASAGAQTPEDSVKNAINKLFSGMKKADIGLLRSSIADSIIFQTIVQGKDGNVVVKNESVDEFIDFVSKQSN